MPTSRVYQVIRVLQRKKEKKSLQIQTNHGLTVDEQIEITTEHLKTMLNKAEPEERENRTEETHTTAENPETEVIVMRIVDGELVIEKETGQGISE